MHGARAVNPGGTGTKGAFALPYRPCRGGGSAEVRLRLSAEGHRLDAAWSRAMRDRQAEADEFYAALAPADASSDEAAVMRQAFAGMLWSKQFYHYDVDRWLKGDPQPAAAAGEAQAGTTSGGTSTTPTSSPCRTSGSTPGTRPGTWRFTAWPSPIVDPAFAKDQLLLLCREWYMHPNGQIPAYEWDFGDVNPPVHAWAALRVFRDCSGAGEPTSTFLERVFHKLLLNFTWWVNRKDAEGNNIFEGGFLGLDNIGPSTGRSRSPRAGGSSSPTAPPGWPCTASTCSRSPWSSPSTTGRMRIGHQVPRALRLHRHRHQRARACGTRKTASTTTSSGSRGGERIPVRVRSMVGLIPLSPRPRSARPP